MAGSGDKKQLGKILLRQKVVTPGELDELLEGQRRAPGSRLASAAARTGRVETVDLLRALSEQHGVPGIDLSQVVVPTENLRLVPVDVAKECSILPFSVNDGELFLAMADPQDRRTIEEIEFVTGRTVHAYVALHEQLGKVVDEAYALLASGEPNYVGPNAPTAYLESLGLRASIKPPPPAPPPKREPTRDPASAPAVFVPKASRPTGEKRGPTLDPVFASRVAPLPRDEIANALRGPDGAPKILVVDDEDDIRRMLRRVLQGKGYRVFEAATGTEALQLVNDEVLDLIVLDAMLPEIHGFELCRRIKNSQTHGHIPIVMVSAVYRGWRFAEDLRVSYGVEAFLEKPFKIGDVVEAVERALEGRTGPVDPDDALSDAASEALQSGIESYKAGRLEEAVTHLRRGVGLEPLSFRLHYHLGLLYGRGDDSFGAIQEMETAVDLAPRNFAALKNLAVLYQRAGFKHRAIEIWERALGSAPDDETKRGIKDHLMSLL